jgi:hypothetical protein
LKQPDEKNAAIVTATMVAIRRISPRMMRPPPIRAYVLRHPHRDPRRDVFLLYDIAFPPAISFGFRRGCARQAFRG